MTQIQKNSEWKQSTQNTEINAEWYAEQNAEHNASKKLSHLLSQTTALKDLQVFWHNKSQLELPESLWSMIIYEVFGGLYELTAYVSKTNKGLRHHQGRPSFPPQLCLAKKILGNLSRFLANAMFIIAKIQELFILLKKKMELIFHFSLL